MGVTGLWTLIDEAGTRVNVDTLSQKVLAIDLSIWINQSLKGFRDKNGRHVENAHLLGLFYRLCKLLFYQIKPIAVFDGECPTLKRHTIQKRMERRNKLQRKAKTLSLNVLENYISSQLSSASTSKASSSSSNTQKDNQSKSISDLKKIQKFVQNTFLSDFYLPQNDPKQVDCYQSFVELANRNKISDSDNEIESNDDDNDEDDNKPLENRSMLQQRKSYHHPQLQNIYDIDINSEHFRSLPAVTRYEILVELRESYKGRKTTSINLLPQKPDEFSQFQLAKILKKRNLQEEIDKLIEELNGYIVKKDDIDELLQATNSEVLKSSLQSGSGLNQIKTGTLASDEQTRFLLLKRLNQAIEEFSVNEEQEEEEEKASELNVNLNVYNVPNVLPGQTKIETDTERIEILSQATNDSQPMQFESKNLSKNLDKNIKKYSKNFIENSKLILSDGEETESSEDTTDDFIEVSEIEDEMEKTELFDEDVPYDTSYTMDIVVDNDLKKTDDENQNEELNNNEKLVTEETIDKIDCTTISANLIEPNEKEIEIVNVETPTPQKPSIESEANLVLNEKNSNQIEKKPPENEEEIKGKINETKSETETKISEKVGKKPTIDIRKLIAESKESAKLERQAQTVTGQLIEECQELLRLFGIPWIVAPAEAEAQCATLEELGLCDGIITDDSDVFLFGGKTIYRNFFTNSKMIMKYNLDDLHKFYGLNQTKFICIGMLCGTDYTMGIENVGPVTAMEILTQFPSDNGMECLEKFTKWYRNRILDKSNNKPENSIREKFLRLSLPSTFPSRIVFDAYINCNVNRSTDKFSWSMPQLSEIRRFTLERFGWSESKTDAFLLPVLKNLNSKQTQKRIDLYFQPNRIISNNSISEKLKIKRSKRLNEAIRKNIQLMQKSKNNIINNINSKDDDRIRKRKKKNFHDPIKQVKVQQKSCSSRKKNVPKNPTTTTTKLVLSEESSSSD